MQDAVRGPLGLKDRFRYTACYTRCLPRGAVVLDRCNPQLGTVPRHIGMVPGQPGKLQAIRAKPRGRIKIVARDQNLCLAVGEIDADDGIDGFSTGLGVVFPYTD